MHTRKHVADAYNRPDMVAFHELLATRQGLWESEQRLIDRYFRPPARLLVVGCGTGREIFPLEQQGFDVTGLDLAGEMLCKAHERRQCTDSHVNLHQGDVVQLPYRQESFEQGLMLSQVIQHIPQRRCRQQALREMYRVLKPGGHCILSAYNTARSFLAFLLVGRRYWRLFQEQARPEEEPQQCHRNHFGRNRFIARVVKRILWELHPAIWSYSDPLPLAARMLFAALCAATNLQRSLRAKLSQAPEHLLEPNDLALDFPHFTFHLCLSRGNLFMHFPDAPEMIADLTLAGFRLREYRSLEELQQGQVFSEKLRSTKRLLFYIAQKPVMLKNGVEVPGTLSIQKS